PPGLANALGLLLTLFVRPAIKQGVPIFMLTKPTRGSGAGTLQTGLSIVAFGRDVTTVKFQADDAELAKTLLSEARSGASAVFFDNVVGSIDAPSLAQATTTGKLRGRVLGQTRMIEAPFRMVVVFAGNRPTLSEELVDRAVLLD
ncbi:hypothetical protein, partial [Klebsiella pneumoniae]|uniref:hypothetical protein n=1 Tax=Klebsiella pneumoniae TaxID=573 RepID=UPI0037BE7BB9